MRIAKPSERLLFLLSLLALACLMLWPSSPQEPHKPRSVVSAELMRFRDFDFGHNGFVDKDWDTGETKLIGTVYRFGIFKIFVGTRYED